MYAWENKTVIDAHDKLLIHFQILVHLELGKKKKNPLPLLYNGVMKHGNWPYIHDKSLIQ